MLQPIEDRYTRPGETETNAKGSKGVLRGPESNIVTPGAPPDHDGKRKHSKLHNNGDNSKHDIDIRNSSTNRNLQMRMPQDERSTDGDRGLQKQFPNSEPNANSDPTGDRENRRIDENEKGKDDKVVKTVVKKTVENEKPRDRFTL